MFAVLGNKIMRSIVHTCKQVVAFVNDDGAVTPCKNGCKERSYFNVLELSKPVRNADGVVFNKCRLVVLLDLTVKKIFKVVSGVLPHQVKLSWKRLKELQQMDEEALPRLDRKKVCHECTTEKIRILICTSSMIPAIK